MISRMQTFKRKLQTLHDEEQAIHAQSKKRIQHLQDLYEIPSLADVRYEDWSRTRLDRLLVDYLLRAGYSKSGEKLAKEKGIEDLVDLDVFVQCQKIADSLSRGETKDALMWCIENKTALKKLGVSMPIATYQPMNVTESLSSKITSNSSFDYNNTSK